MRAVLLIALLASLSFAGPKLAPDLPTDATAMVDVIIQFKTPPTKKELKQLGPYGQMKKVFRNINGANLQLPMSVVQAMENDPNVIYISPNRTSTGMLDIVTATVNAPAAWQFGLDGTGVGVAVIDSGVTPKDDLMQADGVTSRIVYSESFIGVADTTDAYGHGTHVAGIVGGNGKDSSGPGFNRTYRGLAPNVNLINLRVLDQNGAGQEANVIAAIDRAIQLQSTYNIRVINLSLGHPIYESYTLDPLCQEVEAAWRAGIIVVTAAGNYGRDNSHGTHGYGTIVSPGNDPYVITVGATKTNGTTSRTDDSVASYSSKGPTLIDHIVKPDLVAPGNNVVSLLASPNCTLIQNFPRTAVSANNYETWGTYSTSVPNYFRLSGTSMATPVVSGVAALLLQQQPFLTPDQVKARLMKTAGKMLPKFSSGMDILSFNTYNNEADIFTIGAGYLDIQAALASTDMVSLPALSPTAVYDPLTRTVTVVRDFSVVWGDSYLWRDSVVWGTAVFGALSYNGYSVVWGDSTGLGFSVVWGDCTSGGFSVVWGSSVGATSAMQAFSADDGDE
jgi:serine protease AprX